MARLIAWFTCDVKSHSGHEETVGVLSCRDGGDLFMGYIFLNKNKYTARGQAAC